MLIVRLLEDALEKHHAVTEFNQIWVSDQSLHQDFLQKLLRLHATGHGRGPAEVPLCRMLLHPTCLTAERLEDLASVLPSRFGSVGFGIQQVRLSWAPRKHDYID